MNLVILFLFYQFPELFPNLAVVIGISPPNGVIRIVWAYVWGGIRNFLSYVCFSCNCLVTSSTSRRSMDSGRQSIAKSFSGLFRPTSDKSNGTGHEMERDSSMFNRKYVSEDEDFDNIGFEDRVYGESLVENPVLDAALRVVSNDRTMTTSSSTTITTTTTITKTTSTTTNAIDASNIAALSLTNTTAPFVPSTTTTTTSSNHTEHTSDSSSSHNNHQHYASQYQSFSAVCGEKFDTSSCRDSNVSTFEIAIGDDDRGSNSMRTSDYGRESYSGISANAIKSTISSSNNHH